MFALKMVVMERYNFSGIQCVCASTPSPLSALPDLDSLIHTSSRHHRADHTITINIKTSLLAILFQSLIQYLRYASNEMIVCFQCLHAATRFQIPNLERLII